jgi:hypothetical protein
MKTVEFLLEGGYTGGHTSNANWDTDVELRERDRLLSIYPNIKTLAFHNEGNVSGYYPSIIVKAEQEIIDKIIENKLLWFKETYNVVNNESYWGHRNIESKLEEQ